jgi:hypothetical protein
MINPGAHHRSAKSVRVRAHIADGVPALCLLSTDVRTRLEARATTEVRTSVLIVEAHDLMRSSAGNALLETEAPPSCGVSHFWSTEIAM